MLTKIDSNRTFGTHIFFVKIGVSESGKTNVYHVYAKEPATLLGEVKWYGPWRTYCFYPQQHTLFEHKCLSEITEFLELERRNHGKH